jgi:hypothetical protein
MTDRELLEAAAKAAGVEYRPEGGYRVTGHGATGMPLLEKWNPLTDDGDALRLAVKLKFQIHIDNGYGTAVRRPDQNWQACEAHKYGGIEAATRRAIVRAAAAMAG